MTTVAGRFFDAQRSEVHAATLSLGEDGSCLFDMEQRHLRVPRSQVTVSDRIGSVPRRLRLPDGAEFETSDNDGIDVLLGVRRSGLPMVVDLLERHWGAALGALVAVALVSFATIQYGLPALSGWAARRAPPEVDLRIGSQVMEALDQTLLKPSRLPPQRQSWLASVFVRMTADLHDGHQYRLELRSGRLGPNAFALPSGIIVMTDQLVELAQDDEELMAVLAHEIGHVRGRHALRHIIQGIGVSALAVAVLGDISSLSAVASAAPALVKARNSRELEREADAYAREWLERNRIPAGRFDDILCRISGGQDGDRDGPYAYFSSHPETGERARCARSAPGATPGSH